MLLLDELRDAWRSESRAHRVALLAIGFIGVALRLAYIDQPMRYDESVTYLYFVRHPWADALSNYQYPNNHLFHTALVKALVTVFGNSPIVLRIPALLAGVVIIPATYAATRELYGARAALFAAAIVSASAELTLFSTNARGYSLVVLAFLLLILVGARILRGDDQQSWIEFIVISWLGAWTIPIMLYPFGSIVAWLALSLLVAGRTGDVRKLGIAVAAVGGLTFASYWPVIQRSGVAAITNNAFVRSSEWLLFLHDLVNTTGEALVGWSTGVPLLVTIPLLLFGVAALRRHAALSRTTVGIPVAAFIWCSWLLVVNHRAPFARVWLWLLPVIGALAGAGLLRFLESRSRLRVLGDRFPLVAVVICALFAASIGYSQTVPRSGETGAYPDARRVADWLRTESKPTDRVLAPIPTNAPLEYYAVRAGIRPDIFTADETRAERLLTIVERLPGQRIDQLTLKAAPKDTSKFRVDKVIAMPLSSIVVFARRHAQ